MKNHPIVMEFHNNTLLDLKDWVRNYSENCYKINMPLPTYLFIKIGSDPKNLKSIQR